MSNSQRDRVVRDAFAAVAEEFIRLVEVDKSGAVTIHFQNGVPLTTSWEFKGRTIQRIPARDDAA